MCTVTQMLKRLHSFNVTQAAEKWFNDTRQYAAMELRAQWAMGQGGNGPFPFYSKESVEKYNKKPGPWRLYETGKLSRGIYFKAKGGIVESFSTDSKADMIEARLTGFYGPMGTGRDYAPFKLSEQSREELQPILQAALIEEGKKKFKL